VPINDKYKPQTIPADRVKFWAVARMKYSPVERGGAE
jgi:hypothetical protein